jgi:hypothetical protein
MSNIRISQATHAALRSLADVKGESLKAALHKVVEVYRDHHFCLHSLRAKLKAMSDETRQDWSKLQVKDPAIRPGSPEDTQYQTREALLCGLHVGLYLALHCLDRYLPSSVDGERHEQLLQVPDVPIDGRQTAWTDHRRRQQSERMKAYWRRKRQEAAP